MARETLHLMVVDDEPGMRLGVERALERFVYRPEESETEIGLRVTSAGSGEQALELAAGVLPDIVLLDQKLPGISGIEVLSRILASKPDTLVVIITAYATLESAVRATKLGAFDFLAKPFTPDELRDIVRGTVDQLLLQRRAQQLAKERRRIRFDFLSVLAHELKGPLGAVEGYLRILQDPAMIRDPAVLGRMVDRSLVRLEGMKSLVFDLLDLTRIESGQRERNIRSVDVTGIARSVIDSALPKARERDVTVALHGAPVVGEADPDEIALILSNLLTNAIVYNRRGGRVDVTCECRDGKKVIVVADTGIGMSAEEIETIFTEFGRIKNEKTRDILGSGLGLAIVKSLTGLYHGSLEVESRPDAGSTFTVVLGPPVEEPHADGRQRPGASPMGGDPSRA